MLSVAPGARIFMAVGPVDMRRSFDGLCATITEALGGDPLSGDVFLFRGKRADRLKAIAWDRTGLAIWYKLLRSGVSRHIGTGGIDKAGQRPMTRDPALTSGPLISAPKVPLLSR
jgi:hypothetical protein